MDIYKNRLNEIISLEKSVCNLNKMLNHLGNHATLFNAKNVVKIAEEISAQITLLDTKLQSDYSTGAVSLQKYGTLKDMLYDVELLYKQFE